MKLVIVALFAAFSIGCASTPHGPLTVHQRIEAACVSAGTAYGVIAVVNNVHPLTADQQNTVLRAKAKVDQRCKLAPGEDYPYTLNDVALSELEDAAANLKAVKGAVK